jgi:hypothetical protein
MIALLKCKTLAHGFFSAFLPRSIDLESGEVTPRQLIEGAEVIA